VQKTLSPIWKWGIGAGIPLALLIFVFAMMSGKAADGPEKQAADEKEAFKIVEALPIPQNLKTFETMNTGMMHFKTRCSECHGFEGKGSRRAPSLTDGAWINGAGRFEDILEVISDGRPAKGMPSWGGKLRSEDLRSIAAYVVYLHAAVKP
jgi:mono/diheme cytochrome c family protein